MAKRNDENLPKTGEKREVGNKKPPVEHQFKRGNPGGPGRPAGESLTDKLKRILAAIDGKETGAEALTKMAYKSAKRGDFRFFKEIIDRVDGKMPDRIANADGGDIVIRVLREPFKRATEEDDDA